MASETSAIALRSEEIRKEMPVATASGGGVANLSHDLFFILLYFIIKNFCMQLNRFYNVIVSEIKLFSYSYERDSMSGLHKSYLIINVIGMTL